MKHSLGIVLALLVGAGCSRRTSEPPPPPAIASDTPAVSGSASAATGSAPAATPETIRESEVAAAQRDAERPCEHRVAVFEGSLDVDATTYVRPVEHGDAWSDEPIRALDRVLTTAPKVEFTLDYPFEKPFTGSVTGAITLRRIIDAVRAGFHHMYEGTTQRDIAPKLENKDVRGPYGRAFHVIGDLVIEHIDLCDDRWLDISIGS